MEKEHRKSELRKGGKITTLVIHAPDYRVKGGAKSFEAIFESGIGPGYAISQKDLSRLPPDSKVVLLRKDKNQKRAEGRLVKLVFTGGTIPQGIKRYDVHFNDRKLVPYKAERLNRFGVAVIDC